MLSGYVDRIEPGYIAGWAADTDTPDSVEEVIVYVDGKRATRVPCDRLRQDLRDLGKYGRGYHGFTWEVSPPIPLYLLDRITVRFARSGATLPRGEVAPAGGTTLNAILVTAAGRSGTTLMMQRLGGSPEVCIAKSHPFEIRLISYWSTVVATPLPELPTTSVRCIRTDWRAMASRSEQILSRTPTTPRCFMQVREQLNTSRHTFHGSLATRPGPQSMSIICE